MKASAYCASLFLAGLTVLAAAPNPKDIAAVMADAVSWKKTAVVQDLLDHGADPNMTLAYGSTPLIGCAIHSDVATTELLISRGADVNRTNTDGQTPLIFAARQGAVDLVKLLLAHGAKVDARDKSRTTALKWVADVGELSHTDAAEVLLKTGADPNAEDNSYETPLMRAATRNWVELALILIEHGADVNHRNERGDTALSYAVDRQANPEVIVFLAEHGADLNIKTPLVTAAAHRNVALVDVLLDKGADANVRNPEGETALMRMCTVGDSAGYLPVIKSLLVHGAAINVVTNSGQTLLEAARWRLEPSRDEFLRLLREAELKFADQQATGAPLPAAAQEAFDRGLRAAKQQSWAVAIRHFDEARKAAPDYRTPLYNLGLAEAQVPGRELRAICWLEASLALAPHASNATAMREQITDLEVRAEANRDKILGLLKATAVKMNSTFPDYWNVAAGAYATAGDLDGALAIIESMPRATPDVRARELSDLIDALFRWREYDLKAEMDELLYAHRLADARTVIGAIGVSNDAARDSAHYWLALDAIQHGDLATGRSELSEFRDGTPMLVIERLIDGYLASGRRDDAARLLAAYDAAYRELKQKNRNNNVGYDAIRVHVRLGDIAGAQAFLADTVDVPGFKYHQEAVRLIENARRQPAAAESSPRPLPPVPRTLWGPVENAEGWSYFAKQYLSSTLFTDFPSAMQHAPPSASASSSNDAWQLFTKLRDQANEISSAIEGIRALRAAQSKTPSQQAGSR